jgi:hypothetical protein
MLKGAQRTQRNTKRTIFFLRSQTVFVKQKQILRDSAESAGDKLRFSPRKDAKFAKKYKRFKGAKLIASQSKGIKLFCSKISSAESAGEKTSLYIF